MKGLLSIVFCLNAKEEVAIEPAAYTFLCIFSRMSILHIPYASYIHLYVFIPFIMGNFPSLYYDHPLNFIDFC